VINFPNPFEEEAEQKWPETFAESQRRLSELSGEEVEAVFEEGSSISRDLASALLDGHSIDSPKVNGLIGRHYQWICNFWTPTSEAYVGLGQMYVEDPRFNAHYEEFAPGLAAFIALAIEKYASDSLT
jgi:MerR family transcriptional regulator, thiopeptide resistance regulator